MTGPKPPIDHTELPPEVVVERRGRWVHLVYIRTRTVGGLAMRYGPDGYGWHVFGRRRAERKARRVLRRYIAAQEREERNRWEAVTIRADEVRR